MIRGKWPLLTSTADYFNQLNNTLQPYLSLKKGILPFTVCRMLLL